MTLGLDQWFDIVVVFVAGFLGGAVNAIAGGGTIISFPTLVQLGLPPITANVTSAISLWPGSFSGAWGFRREIAKAGAHWQWLNIPSLLGGILGAFLLVNLPSGVFAAVAPYLVLGATGLIALGRPIERRLRRSFGGGESLRRDIVAFAVLLFVATYGGYFGASLGILILTSLTLVGVGDIRQANGLKNLFSGVIKGVAVVYFVFTKAIVWDVAILMMVAATLGGYVAAVVGRRMEEHVLRWVIILIGVAMAITLLVR